MKEKLMQYKKKIIVTFVTIAILAIAIAGGYFGIGYNYALKNDNYSEDQIKQIALEQVEGEVVSLHKELDIEDSQLSHSEFEYEVEIKTPQNTLVEITVHSRTGTVDLDDDHHFHR